MNALRQLMIAEQFSHRQAKKWGYNIGGHESCLSKKNEQQKEYSLANIQLRNFQPDIPKTEQIRQIEAQIRTIQNERILMQLNDKRDNKNYDSLTGKSDLTRMVEEKIHEYNDIIDHLHIIKRSKQRHQRKTKINVKNAFAHILEQIQEQKNKLTQAELKDKIVINQKIVNLYKQCKEKLNITKSYFPNRNNTSDSIKIPMKFYSLNKTQPNFKIKKRRKNVQITSNEPQREEENEQDSEAVMNLNRKHNRIERHIELSRKMFDQCQQKTSKYIQAIETKFMNKTALNQMKNKKFLRRLREIELVIEDKIHLSPFKEQKITSNTQLSFRSSKQEQKEVIISNWLAKRSPKFNKVSGTKILLKYDSHAEAKSMLEGTPSKEMKPIYQDKNQAYFLAENEEDADYWRTCRTEKINLLLKTKR